jgi:hypothetical protein
LRMLCQRSLELPALKIIVELSVIAL